MPSSSHPGTFRRRTPAPVAISALSKLHVSLFDRRSVRAETSSSLTVTRLKTSTRCSSYHGVGLGHEAGAAAEHRDDQGAVGQGDILHPLAGGGGALADLDLDDLEVLLFEGEQLDEPVFGHLVLDQAEDQVGGGHCRLHPE